MLFRTLLSAAALTGALAAQFSVVIPAGTAAVEGNTLNAFPWGRGTAGLYHQSIYDSSHFTSQGVTYPIIIQGLRWRPNTNGALTASGYGTATVKLSTCPVDEAVTTAVIAANQGPDLATVFSGAVSWAAQPAQVGPCPFGIVVPFSVPFLYNPAAGDLNIEVDLPTQTTAPASFSLDVQSTGSLASRVFMSTGYPTGTVFVGHSHGVVVQVDYVPAAGLYAGFQTDVQTGPSPLTVNFQDRSYSSDVGGVLAWAWDFDGDTVIDSTLQNPSWTYNNCGSYSPTLTVFDATHAPDTLTRTNLITTDAVSANFTHQVIGPYTVMFTDTSTGPPTSWAWDLDGDSVIDSTAQNAAWVYPNGSPATVSLTVTRLCSAPSTITRTIVPVQSISHNALANNGLSSGASVYFDIDVTNPAGINITSMDVAPSVINTAFTVQMFVKPGTHVGSTGNAAAWVSAGIGSSAGGANSAIPSANVAFPQATYLAPGLHGIKLWYIGAGPRYQTGNTTPGANVATNGDLTMTLGISRGSTITNAWAGSDIVNRWWTGVLYYSSHNLGGLAGYGSFAPGCAGSLGVPHLTSNLPQLGSVMNTTIDNVPAGLGIMITGLLNVVTDLTPFGAPGCMVQASPDANSILFGAGTSVVNSFAIPNAAALSGFVLHHQALVIDPVVNALGAVMSDAASFQLGL